MFIISTAAFATEVPGPKMAGSHACLVKEVVVLRRNHTTCDYHNILTPKLFQFFDQLRDEGLMTCSK